jgi:RimJ/RimL family protein N-acetyltransferase
MSELTLRKARADDRELLREWRNDPAVRAASRNTHEVDEQEHARWLRDLLANPDRHLLIAELDGEPIGQVRFDRMRGYCYEISASLSERARGAGHGTLLLAGSLDWLWRWTNADASVAEVRESNDASLRAFRAAGFVDSGSADGFAVLIARRPEPWAPEVPGDRTTALEFSG